ncbi:MAG: hypothetical protein H7287_02160 [Thermoleophilia bacterium]|nr:hypothetical protein [Thermoleophilia bacterium]
MTLPDLHEAHFRVARVSGLLLPGFTKLIRFDASGAPLDGVTYLWGIRIGAFTVHSADEFGELDAGLRALRYHTWPVVDILEPPPEPAHGSPDCRGELRLPGGRRVRFCRFALEPIASVARRSPDTRR